VSAAETRDRILDAAWELIRRGGIADVRMADIAAAAGVSRQLVYLYFESWQGLLVAVTRRHDGRSGMAAAVAEAHALEPRASLEALLRAWCAYIPEILPVARALEAAGTEAWEDRMADLRAQFRRAVDRLAAAGELAPHWSPGQAVDWIWARSHVAGWQHLVVERGWDPAEYTERCVRSILAEIASAAPRRAAGPAARPE
jgi:AcrR family transcriptional regulator